MSSGSGHSEQPITRFYNCRKARFDSEYRSPFVPPLPNLDEVWVRNGKIIDGQEVFFRENVKPDINVDCSGGILAPGLIDVQINGGWGYDFACADNLEEGLCIVGQNLLKHGVTSFCPTIVSSSPSTYRKVLPLLAPRVGNKTLGANVLGAHVEGPFISLQKKGCHDPQNILSPEKGMESVRESLGDDFLKNMAILTIAPELTG